MSERPGESTTGGTIRNVALLDLTTMTPEALARVESISNVATVILPRSLSEAFASIPQRNIANVVPVPDGARLSVHTGVVTMDGASLAAGGDEQTALVVTGALVVTSPIDRVGFGDIVVIGALVAPEGSQAALAGALRRVVGSTAHYRWVEGQTVKVLQGEMRVRGDFLANANGNPDDVVLAAGALVVTSPVPSVGFREIVVVGSLLAPEESEAVLSPALTIVGNVFWYAAPPRLFNGADRFGAAFFELLDGPVTLVLNGSFELEPDVPREIVRERVAAIVLNGTLRASADLVPLLQVLTVQKQGVIETAGEETGDLGR
jgi:hypothetical protein